jgi:hypothetical protein
MPEETPSGVTWRRISTPMIKQRRRTAPPLIRQSTLLHTLPFLIFFFFGVGPNYLIDNTTLT